MCSDKYTCHIINTMSSVPFPISELHHYDILTKTLNCLINVQTAMKINSINGFMYFVTGKSGVRVGVKYFQKYLSQVQVLFKFASTSSCTRSTWMASSKFSIKYKFKYQVLL